MAEEQVSKGFILDILNSVFSWFNTNEKAALWVIIVVLGYMVIEAKEDKRVTQEKMYEKIITKMEHDLNKKIDPLKAKQDSVAATVDTTRGKIQTLINKIDKKLSQ